MFSQQLTASPRFRAGENVHRLTAAMTASSSGGPVLDRRSRLTREACPPCETRTRTITISLTARARSSTGTCGSTRRCTRGGSLTSLVSKNGPVAGAGAGVGVESIETAAACSFAVVAGAGITGLSGAGLRTATVALMEGFGTDFTALDRAATGCAAADARTVVADLVVTNDW